MTILFWIFSVLSLAVGCFTSFILYLAHGLALAHSLFGDIVCILGMLSLLVCLVCVVLGIIRLHKGSAKKAFVFALAGILYCGLMFAGVCIDEAADTIRLRKSVAERNKQAYGENWNAPPAIEGLPEHYQELLNKYYAVVRDTWPAEQLTDLGALSMADYYGDTPLYNIGFALMDLNGDNIEELIIGAVAKDAETGNEIFCIYSDPSNPHYSINSVEGNVYYLHPGQGDSTYLVEIAGTDRAWALVPANGETLFDFNPWEGALDPAGRLTLTLTPFSSYK